MGCWGVILHDDINIRSLIYTHTHMHTHTHTHMHLPRQLAVTQSPTGAIPMSQAWRHPLAQPGTRSGGSLDLRVTPCNHRECTMQCDTCDSLIGAIFTVNITNQPLKDNQSFSKSVLHYNSSQKHHMGIQYSTTSINHVTPHNTTPPSLTVHSGILSSLQRQLELHRIHRHLLVSDGHCECAQRGLRDHQSVQ